ncbi:MAG: PhzF family phenazine biosynthesis protein [Thermoanaerobaculia bacterium]|nr:PhzF family phenazine biosynthesis protein [Thermoanaerobaculia bacterium]
MSIPIFQVDAFTDRPFRGNPAAVCLLDTAADPVWMQAVALEMNLSETAFLSPREGGFDLRWFTPTVEVALCGHATLASAHVLWSEGILPRESPARFHTASGWLVAHRHEDWIELDFPSAPAAATPVPSELLGALGTGALWTGHNRFDHLVEVDSEATLLALAPDFAALRHLTKRGVMVTCASTRDDADFVSRFFAPAAGSTKTPSPARRIAAWVRSGPSGWASRRSSVTPRRTSTPGPA